MKQQNITTCADTLFYVCHLFYFLGNNFRLLLGGLP